MLSSAASVRGWLIWSERVAGLLRKPGFFTPRYPSNATLGISVGAIAGVVIAFATQNIGSSVIAAVMILSTRMIRVGEEITIGQIKGTIAEINLTQTVLSVEDNVVFVPNSMIISNIVQRKKRNLDKNTNVRDW